jgi:pyruvate formate lyase activating enzyme
VAICPYGALEMVGKLQTIPEIVEEIEKDRLFYVNSHGGVTFSGGEPLVQAQFTMEVFKICQQKAIHTTLDTAGCVPWARMERVLEFTDLVLYDVKQLDPAIHKHWTGRTNKLILNNFTKTVKMVSTWVRVPIIPGFSDFAEFIKRLSRLISGLGNTKIEKISLLSYHSWGEQKYKKLGRDYKPLSMIKDPKIEVDELKKIIESYGIEVTMDR